MEKIIVDHNFNIPEVAVILGNFDGIHKGHRLLLEKAKDIAKQKDIKIALFTFEPHPSFIISNMKAKDLIYTSYEKQKLFQKENVDYYIEMPFDKSTAKMSPESFIEDILINKINAKVVIVGSDYRFGGGRAGDYRMIQKYAEIYGFEVIVLDKLEYSHQEISSTWIRELIKDGNISLANELMGRPFSITGCVQYGAQIGRSIGFPTANLIPESSKLLPPFGVYIAKVMLNDNEYLGITNIGNKPTVNGDKTTVETYILNFEKFIYDEEITVKLYKYIRPEKKFNSLDELKLQINLDVDQLVEYFKSY